LHRLSRTTKNPRDCRKKRDFVCRVTKFSGCAKN